MKTSFENFSGADYVDGACLILDNAKKHIQTGELLKNEEIYGIAISHLILGAEEYIKSFVLLCLSGVDDFLNDKEKIDLFKNHKFKHKNIEELLKSMTNEAADEFENGFFERLVNNQEPASKFSVDGFHLNKTFKLVSFSEKDLNRILSWLDKANDLKNNGFYINLKDGWESPQQFNLEDYKNAFQVVNLLIKAIEPLFTLPLTDEQLIDYLNSKNII